MQRRFNALLGLALGVCTWPLALVAWPLFLAWFMWNETEEERPSDQSQRPSANAQRKAQKRVESLLHSSFSFLFVLGS